MLAGVLSPVLLDLSRAAVPRLLQVCASYRLFSSSATSSSSTSGGGWDGEGREPPAGQLQQLGAVPHPNMVSISDDKGGAADIPAKAGRPPRVLSVGGSISGCCLALALGRVGCEVEVFERSGKELESQGSGLVLQPDLRDFVTYFGIMLEDVCVTSNGRQYIDRQARVIGEDYTPQLFTGWDTLYRALKSKASSERYHLGAAVQDMRVGEERVSLTLQDGRQYEGELLIGADGGGSRVRSVFWPDVKSSYAGYVAWRGWMTEVECPQPLVGFIENKFTLYQGQNFHILAYVIPGLNGETEPGQRRINWVWYWNTDEPTLGNYLTDISGFQHGHSVPRGMLRPDVAQERRDIARELLPAPLADLVCGTQDIFMQAIHDLLVPSMVYQDRVVLVGDSACVLRPHTAAGTTKAAVNAWSLSKSLQLHNFDLHAALSEYNLQQMELARYLRDVGVTIGTRSQFGGGPSHVVADASYST